MKKTLLLLLISFILFFENAPGQNKDNLTKIDLMLVNGEYNRVVDTCRLILATDSLNSATWYKMGLAYQNLIRDDNSFDCFLKASSLSPENRLYKYTLAKGYHGKGKFKQARPLLENLCMADSMNWNYAFYLTSIYMQEKEYDKSIKIYSRFYEKDSSDYVILDKIGFALLRKGFYPTAIEYFNRSLAIKPENVPSIKNLSFLYASTLRADTAVKLLGMAMKIDTTDIDLYIRRAALNFSRNYTKRALDDYLKVLATGDSTVLYLKRSGIGYSNNFQPNQAIKYLRLAYVRDSSDLEVSSFLARNYEKLNDLKNTAYYYQHNINTLEPFMMQTSMNYYLLAETYKTDTKYKEAIDAYQQGQKIRSEPNINMIIANIYDEKLKDYPKAIHYYQLFIDYFKNGKLKFTPEYVQSAQKRVDYLKQKQTEQAKK